jgi:outer membrane protein assembly factor BamB
MRVWLAVAVFHLASAGIAPAENWPQWRGPHGTGVSLETDLPVRWGPGDNIAWKAPLAGLGVSSPIVWEDRIFVTSQLGKGVLRGGSFPTLARGGQEVDERPLGGRAPAPDDGKVYFLVEAFQRGDGQRLWEYRFEPEGELPEVHSKHNMASPSPVTDGERVYAWFATGQLVALDLDGNLLWKRHLGQEYFPFVINWGHGSSPTLYEELLLLQCYHTPASYLLALNKRTGREVWRVDRDPGVTSFGTPFVAHGAREDELIVNSSQRVEALDPTTGELLWFAGEPRRYATPAPSYDDGILYMSRGYRAGPYLSIRIGGRGDVSKTHVRWRVSTGAPYVSSLVYYQGLVYMANGNGIVTCIDGTDGKKVWQERVGGIYSASPVAAGGRIYLLNESGETVVLRAGRELQILERNPMGERAVASPAVSGGQLFLRTDAHLIRVGSDSPGTRR